MPSDDGAPEARPDDPHRADTVQPFEADVIAARLRASGIEATVGADSIYESVSFVEGVPVLVSADDAPRALALLEATKDD